MTHPLSKRQKAVLSQLSTRAFNWCGREMGYATPADYRHAAVAHITGGVAGGLRHCTQQHYVPLYNHFAAVLGLKPLTDRTPQTPWQKELAMLQDALARFELREEYAAAIIRSRFGYGDNLTFADLTLRLTPEELRQISYTIINRGRAKTRKLAAQTNTPIPDEPHRSHSTPPPTRLAAHFPAKKC